MPIDQKLEESGHTVEDGRPLVSAVDKQRLRNLERCSRVKEQSPSQGKADCRLMSKGNQPIMSRLEDSMVKARWGSPEVQRLRLSFSPFLFS